MRILVIGTGGREHALLWKLRNDDPAAELFITRGNGGTRALATSIPLDAADAPALATWAASNRIDLTIVGPEAALANGIADVFERHGLALFGPTRDAAAIESSKAYAKQLMTRAGVPTASYRAFTDLEAAERYIAEQDGPLVVKASGLAAGKGALVCDSPEEAVSSARSMMRDGIFGAAGQEIVIEERLSGEELSVLAVSDGYDVALLMPAQDHKRIGEADTGPNTGGMGVYAPVSLVDDALLDRVRREIFLPTLAAMRADKRTFRGVLYAGLMLTERGPQVIEFNARFGDPETQVVLPMLDSSLLDLLLPVARGERIDRSTVRWRSGAALTTVLAAHNYPETPETGQVVSIPADLPADVLVFHAGTKLLENGDVVTSGGRVLAVTGLGKDLIEAAASSRAVAEAIQFEGKYYRRDIGWRELARLQATPHVAR
ncbi:MAG TPA: phosphoribosylamine--glycine ligase [Longimicrobiales bacterium]